MSGARRVAVTGAASGIGAATARLLASRGWRVACLDRDIEGARRTAGADGVVLEVGDDDQPYRLHARTVINCAGLWASRVACAIDGLDAASIPRTWFAKGNYYALAGRAPFSRLVYPVPEPGGLGVHLTLDLGGQARFGADVEWLEGGRIDFLVDPKRAERFTAEIRAYWPALPDHALQPAYAGIRPKISPPGAPAADFLFATHGSPHYLGLYGIESPGLTASLAIADHVLALAGSAACRPRKGCIPFARSARSSRPHWPQRRRAR